MSNTHKDLDPTKARTKQEIFDVVVWHLARQGAVSMSAGLCAYRGEQGRKCAVGCLLADDEYDPGMEGRSVGGDDPVGLPLRLRTDAHILSDLQAAHDGASAFYFSGSVMIDVFKNNLRAVAGRHRLSAAAVDEAFGT